MNHLNEKAWPLLEQFASQSDELNCKCSQQSCGALVIDAGVFVRGGFSAGLRIIELCTAGLAELRIVLEKLGSGLWPHVNLHIDQPFWGAFICQSANWSVQLGNVQGMGSGPACLLAEKKYFQSEFGIEEKAECAVLVLEAGSLPDDQTCVQLAERCRVHPSRLGVVVAPTASLSGTVQIAGRSVETALHKLHHLGIDLQKVHSAMGRCPVASPAGGDMAALGRVNDIMACGAQVWLSVSELEQNNLDNLVSKVPASNSPDYGKPFLEILSKAGDFYGIDPGYFAPAEVSILNLDTGQVAQAGSRDEELLIDFLRK